MVDLLISHPRIMPGDLRDPRRVMRAVDGTHVDQASSSLAFAAFLEDCHCRLADSLELVGARVGESKPEPVRPRPNHWPSFN
jgi:hypothetical protein